MKQEQYKLIKKYPGVRSDVDLNDIVVKRQDDHYYYIKTNRYIGNKNDVEKYPEFWQKVEEEFKTGDWVKRLGVIGQGKYAPGDLFKIEKTSLIILDPEGICHSENYISLATNEEIIVHLTKEAEKRGYNSKQKLKPFWSEMKYWQHSYNQPSEYHKEHSFLGKKDVFYYKGGCVYCDGKWAEIIPEEPKLTFGGEEISIEVLYNKIYISCKGETGTYEEIKAIHNACSKYPIYDFGSKRLVMAKLSNNNIWHLHDSANIEILTLTIGCTTGTFAELEAIINTCEEIKES